MASIDELWHLVAEAPDDIERRLVLADALIEDGEPRGELIALQCRGAAASVYVGKALVEFAAERVSELIAANWDRWLGDLAAVVTRQGVTFEDGMLTNIQVGDGPPHAAWAKLATHRELCAVKRIRPVKILGAHYAAFLAGLANAPVTVEVHAPHVFSVIRSKRDRWPIRNLRYGGGLLVRAREDETHEYLGADFRDLAAITPELETLEILSMWGAADKLAEVLPTVRSMFPKLTKIKIEDGYWLREDVRLRQLPFVEIS